MTLGERMRRVLRRGALGTLKSCGAFRWVEASEWRIQRLLILCYHGVSIEDEHEWEPALYIQPQLLERRLRILGEGKYAVLPLGEALERLYHKELPPRSVAITFDDGTYDFFSRAHPLLREVGLPTSVYLTTYYSDLNMPVFHLICSYMMWKARALGTVDLREFGIAQPVRLDSAEARREALQQLLRWTGGQDLTAEQKNAIAARLAEQLHLDYGAMVEKRILQLMNSAEIKELAAAGVDFQLHTHRHRTPNDEALFRKEIRDNRERIAKILPGARSHFCYPSGMYKKEFLCWLEAENVISATTCDTGLATVESDPLLLPRFVDTSGRSDLEFESWVSGIAHFLSLRKRAHPAHMPD